MNMGKVRVTFSAIVVSLLIAACASPAEPSREPSVLAVPNFAASVRVPDGWTHQEGIGEESSHVTMRSADGCLRLSLLAFSSDFPAELLEPSGRVVGSTTFSLADGRAIPAEEIVHGYSRTFRSLVVRGVTQYDLQVTDTCGTSDGDKALRRLASAVTLN